MPQHPHTDIAIVGGGPAGLVAAIALARRGLRTTVYEREVHPELAPRINPDRSYTIDITGHGLRALRHIDATDAFDERMLPFNGIQYHGRAMEEWTEPGWTGSRGDILRALMSVADRHGDAIELRFEHRVEAVDVHAGTVTASRDGRSENRRFDLIVGADGAGSAVRRALEEQIDGYDVTMTSIPNYVTMIALDRMPEEFDPSYLHALSIRHFYVAGAVNGDDGPERPRWFCAIGADRELTFSSTDDVRRFFGKNCPEILDYASEEALAAFARRPAYHVGRTLTCSQLHGGKALLLGDAAGPFPPIGQGLNAAMESAMVLDELIGEAGGDLAGVPAAYNAAWKPEADAVSWISQQTLFENRLNTLRSVLTMAIGQSVVDQAKSSEMWYSEVQRKARRLGRLWTWPKATA